MKKTVVNKIIRVSALEAWDLISDPAGAEHYLPATSSSEVTYNAGTVTRSIFLMDGSYYEETLLHVDNENRELHYQMNEPSPFLYRKLKGWIKVIPIGDDSCAITWTCSYCISNDLAAETDELLMFIIKLAIGNLERFITKASRLASYMQAY